jgi:N-acetylmuramoyl-L-alanine amidase
LKSGYRNLRLTTIPLGLRQFRNIDWAIALARRNRFLIASNLFLLAWLLALPAQAVVLRNAIVTFQNGHTYFEADLTGPIGFSVTAQTSPNRVVLDLPRLRFELPPQAGLQTAGSVMSFHYGVAGKGKARIVLDTKGPVVINQSSLQPGKDGRSSHLVVDLVATSREGFADTLARDHGQAGPVETGAITPPAGAATPAKLTIAIDPGHGGIDPGAISNKGTREKDVVLAFGLALRKALEATGHYTVVMTREGDTFIKLEDRVKSARDQKANLFIAIHADTLEDPAVRGTTLYTVSDKASDAVAEALANKENRTDIITGMDLGKQSEDVANLLINLAQRESRNEAMLFGKKAVMQLHDVTQMTGKPLRSAAFVVLKAPDVPSVLVELGYLSNAADEAALVAPAWREHMASAMVKAINNYFAPSTTVAQ